MPSLFSVVARTTAEELGGAGAIVAVGGQAQPLKVWNLQSDFLHSPTRFQAN